MKFNREPWHPSHEPKNFARTDPTGRWSPIVEKDDSKGWHSFNVMDVIMYGVMRLAMWIMGRKL